MENLGKLREFEKLSKSQGKLREILIFVEKPGKLRENEKGVTYLPPKMYSIEFFSLELLREKFGNTLEISGKLREFSLTKMWPPCNNIVM